MSLFPIVLIAVGLIVLILGNRLAILGAAVGALLGVVLLRLFADDATFQTQLLVVLGLTLVGFIGAAFARGIIDVIILVLGALAGAAITLAVLDLFGIDLGLMNWLLAVAGGVIGLMLIRSARRGGKDWGMVILACLIGALLVTRGLTQLLPSLQNTIIATLLVVVLAGGGAAYHLGLLNRDKAVPPTTTPPSTPPPGSNPPLP
jgi:hypothetical protein